jgi:hypothetical protein
MPLMSPEMADAARDVLALIRSELAKDREATVAILEPLDLEQAKWLLRMTADLAGRFLKERAGEHSEEFLARFARENLT